MTDDPVIDYVELFEGIDEQWYFRGKANNGEIVVSSEGYSSKSNAERAASTTFPDTEQREVTGE